MCVYIYIYIFIFIHARFFSSSHFFLCISIRIIIIINISFLFKTTYIYMDFSAVVSSLHLRSRSGLSQDSSKGGAVETGCSGVHYIIGCFTIQYYHLPLHPPPTAPPFDEYPLSPGNGSPDRRHQAEAPVSSSTNIGVTKLSY